MKIDFDMVMSADVVLYCVLKRILKAKFQEWFDLELYVFLSVNIIGFNGYNIRVCNGMVFNLCLDMFINAPIHIDSSG